MQASVGVGSVVVVAIVVAVAFAAAPSGLPQYAFAEASLAPINLTVAGRIADDDYPHLDAIDEIAAFETASRTYAAVALYDNVQAIQLATDVTERAAYGNDQDNAPLNLVVTTHHPACTAVFMHGRDGVALQTELRPDLIPERSYTDEEIQAGINLTYATTTSLADELMPVLAGRPDVSAVASYSASHPPVLLANSTSPGPWSPGCGDALHGDLFFAVYDVVWQSSRTPGDSGAAVSKSMVNVYISTIDSNAEVLALLEEHGLTPFSIDEPTPANKHRGTVTVYVPVSLLAQLTQLNSVGLVFDLAVNTIEPAHGFGNVVSDAVGENPSADLETTHSDVSGVLVASVIAVAGFGGIAAAFFVRARSGKYAARG